MPNQTVTVLEADLTTQTDVEVLGFGRQAASASKSLTLSTEDKLVLDSLATKLDTAITALQTIDNMVLAAGSANIGDVDVLTVPADPFGVNADAASVTGSISAKLRAIAASLAIIDDVVINANGQATMANSTPVVLANNQTWTPNAEYETVAASQAAQALGATGATGDYIAGLLVIPATTSPGNVLLLDNATSITVFAGGASSVSNLVPFFIPLGLISVSGAWKLTTGANVSVIGIGNFT